MTRRFAQLRAAHALAADIGNPQRRGRGRGGARRGRRHPAGVAAAARTADAGAGPTAAGQPDRPPGRGAAAARGRAQQQADRGRAVPEHRDRGAAPGHHLPQSRPQRAGWRRPGSRWSTASRIAPRCYSGAACYSAIAAGWNGWPGAGLPRSLNAGNAPFVLPVNYMVAGIRRRARAGRTCAELAIAGTGAGRCQCTISCSARRSRCCPSPSSQARASSPRRASSPG